MRGAYSADTMLPVIGIAAAALEATLASPVVAAAMAFTPGATVCTVVVVVATAVAVAADTVVVACSRRHGRPRRQ